MDNNIQEVCFDIGFHTIHGLAQGSAHSEIILCLHGWLDNAASFIPLMPHFKGKHVIAIDWAGHGFSSHRSEDAHYHFIDWVYDLVQLFEINQWQKIDIVAHSMGGMIASAFAAAFPEKVRSLTLIDSIGFVTEKSELTTEQMRKGFASRIKAQKKLPQQKAKHATVDSAIEARMAVSDLGREQAELIVNRGLVKVGNAYTWRSDPRLRCTSPYRLTQTQAKQLMQDIKCPVSLIYGDKGLDMVKQGITIGQKLIANLELHEVSGGHHLHMEQAEQISDIVIKFITNM